VILWFIDRFGLPGSYFRIWGRLVAEHGIQPSSIRVVSLHKALNRQLLTKFGTRKAPTWIPEEAGRITEYIDQAIELTQAKAVVLASPESLACIGLAPEHATLHNLRGSVYWRSGVPHIVMLPMSAWNSMVNQKEIGAANYGFETQESFAQATESRRRAEAHGVSGSRFESKAKGTGVRDSDRAGSAAVHPASSSSVLGRSRESTDNRPGIGTVSENVRTQDHNVLDDPRARVEERDAVHFGGDSGDDRVRNGEIPGTSGGVQQMDSTSIGESDLPDDLDRYSSDSTEAPESGDEDEVESDSDSEETKDEEDGHVDQFFYEPVLSPVGRFALTADVMKLKRIVESGKSADGPKAPIVLHWR
jgi:AAA ATPase containing von Willebrand factor type A (vWA) domain